MENIKDKEEFFNSEKGKKILEERLKNKVKIKRSKDFGIGTMDFDNEYIDTKYFISGDDKTLMAELQIRVNNIIKLAGHEMVYIGKTSNPIKRMTGKDMTKNESFSEVGLVLEVKDHIPPHNIPHLDNNYKKMYVLAQVDTLSAINRIERGLIRHFWDTNRNKTPGGDGDDGGSPYFIYVVVHEDADIFKDTAS